MHVELVESSDYHESGEQPLSGSASSEDTIRLARRVPALEDVRWRSQGNEAPPPPPPRPLRRGAPTAGAVRFGARAAGGGARATATTSPAHGEPYITTSRPPTPARRRQADIKAKYEIQVVLGGGRRRHGGHPPREEEHGADPPGRSRVHLLPPSADSGHERERSGPRNPAEQREESPRRADPASRARRRAPRRALRPGAATTGARRSPAPPRASRPRRPGSASGGGGLAPQRPCCPGGAPPARAAARSSTQPGDGPRRSATVRTETPAFRAPSPRARRPRESPMKPPPRRPSVGAARRSDGTAPQNWQAPPPGGAGGSPRRRSTTSRTRAAAKRHQRGVRVPHRSAGRRARTRRT